MTTTKKTVSATCRARDLEMYAEVLKRHKVCGWYDVEHVARSLYSSRWELMVDTAGGLYHAKSFRTKKELHVYRRKMWSGRKFYIVDSWVRIPAELLKDCKWLMKHLGLY